MGAHILPQGTTIGSLFIALDATPTGSDAANDVVADFTGATAIHMPSPSVLIPVTPNHSQTLGSRFHINIEGMWVIKARVHCITAASVRAAIGLDNAPGDLSIDPVVPNFTTMQDLALRVAAAGDTDPVELSTEPIAITRDMAQDQVAQATGNVRLLLSNNAGAGAAAGALSLALCYLKFVRTGPLPSHLA